MRLNLLQREGKLDEDDVSVLLHALTHIQTIEERERELEDLWEVFVGCPMDRDTYTIRCGLAGLSAGLPAVLIMSIS